MQRRRSRLPSLAARAGRTAAAAARPLLTVRWALGGPVEASTTSKAPATSTAATCKSSKGVQALERAIVGLVQL